MKATTLEIFLIGINLLLVIGLYVSVLLWKKYEKENKVLKRDREFLLNELKIIESTIQN